MLEIHINHNPPQLIHSDFALNFDYPGINSWLADLYALAMPDAVIELYCFRRRLNIQFFVKRIDTYLVLAQRKCVLSQAAVAAHYATMHILPTNITIYDDLAECEAGSILLLAEVDLAEAIQYRPRRQE